MGTHPSGGIKRKRGSKIERCHVRVSHLLMCFLLLFRTAPETRTMHSTMSNRTQGMKRLQAPETKPNNKNKKVALF